MFVWAGKDVAYSESAGKLLLPHLPAGRQVACNRPSMKGSGMQIYSFVF